MLQDQLARGLDLSVQGGSKGNSCPIVWPIPFITFAATVLLRYGNARKFPFLLFLPVPALTPRKLKRHHCTPLMHQRNGSTTQRINEAWELRDNNNVYYGYLLVFMLLSM